MSKDYYQILDIERNATTEQIKKAYKKLAFEYHPDRNPDDNEAIEKFKEINEAYQVLGNENKRAQYDSFGHISDEGLFRDAGFRGGNFGNINDIFGSLFEEVFTTGRRARGTRGRDLKYNLEIPFEKAAFGSQEEIVIPKNVRCEECYGSGAEPGGETICTACNGRGNVEYAKGFFAISQTCSTCRGSGKIIKDHCKVCKGEGVVTREQKVSVRVPPGITDGARLRMKGEGEPGLGGAPDGDLYIEISVKDHPVFTRDINDLYCEVPISIVEAILGGEITVPTMEGTQKFKIPAGTQPGQTFKLKGEGIPELGSGKMGDLYIVAKVEIPAKINKKQKELLKEFSNESDTEQQPLVKEYINKIKEMF